MFPQVGSEITVVVKGHGPDSVFVPMLGAWTVASPKTNTYVGRVVRSDEWLKSDEFNMTTGEKHFPIRTICMKNVISIDGAKPDDMVAGLESIIVEGSKGNNYVVVVRDGVAETCTCPGFQFHGGRCKHLAIAESKNHAS